MAKKSLETLRAEAISKGITTTGQETYEELTTLLKEPEVTLTPEEIADLETKSKEAEQKIKEAQESKKDPVKMYSAEDVKKMFNEFKKEFKKDLNEEEEEEEGERKHTVRISRFNNKFIIALKNLNTDPYFPDRVILSQDLFDDKLKVFIPNVTIVFDDKTDLTLPLETILKVKQSVDCPLLETKITDASVKYGIIEQEEGTQAGYSMKKTGNTVQGKQVMKKYSYMVQIPGHENPVEVGPEVINW